MKCSEFTNEMRHWIVEATKSSLLKLGIANVEVELEVRKMRSGNEYFNLTTSGFNTTPVIYRSIRVCGIGEVEKVSGEDNVYELNITLDYDFDYFSGGRNGVSIGTLRFRVFEDTMRIAFIGFII
jgi:hypothetical protein